jgi:hypothetical protein
LYGASHPPCEYSLVESLSSLSIHVTNPGSTLRGLSGLAAGVESVPTAPPLRVLEVGEMPLNDLIAFMEDPPKGLVRPTVETLRLGVDKSKGSMPHGQLSTIEPASAATSAVVGGDDAGDSGGEGEEGGPRVLEDGKAKVEDVVMTWLTSRRIKAIRSVVFHGLCEPKVDDYFGLPEDVSTAERVLHGVGLLENFCLRWNQAR